MSKMQMAVRRGAVAATLGGVLTVVGLPTVDAHARPVHHATVVASQSGASEASSMVGTGVTPSALGISAAGGVLVSLSALAVRATRRRTGVPLRP